MEQSFVEAIRTKLGVTSLGRSALIGLMALFIMVAVIAGRMLLDTATATEITIDRSAGAVDASSADSTASNAMADGKAEATSAQAIFIHVSGAVRTPGLVELEQGARVADAIEAAGGLADGALVESVNLARKVEDGEHVHLPSEDDVQAVQGATSGAIGVVGAPTAAQLPVAQGGSAGLVNVNTASAAELEQLPGIGPSTAAKIVESRQVEGPFATIEDVQRVSGIGAKKYASIAELICV